MAGNKKSAPIKATPAIPTQRTPKQPKQRTEVTPRRRAILEARENLNQALRRVSQLESDLFRISRKPVDTPEYLGARAELSLAERHVEVLRARLAAARAVPPTQTTHEQPQHSVDLLERLRNGLVKL